MTLVFREDGSIYRPETGEIWRSKVQKELYSEEQISMIKGEAAADALAKHMVKCVKPSSKRDKFMVLVLGMFLAWAAMPKVRHLFYLTLAATTFWFGYTRSSPASPPFALISLLVPLAFLLGLAIGAENAK